MTVLAYPAEKIRIGWRPLVRMAAVVVFWVLAAILLFELDRVLAPRSLAAVIACKVAFLVAAGWAYVRLAAREATVDHALAVGVVWYVLALAAEMTITLRAMTGAGWFVLIGPPDSTLLRAVLFASWVGGPALFARCSSHKRDSLS